MLNVFLNNYKRLSSCLETVEGSEESEAHYELLSNVVNSIPKHNLIVECGDCNAHLGEDDARHTYHKTTNENGTLLLDHANECNLHIMNTRFEKKRSRLCPGQRTNLHAPVAAELATPASASSVTASAV